MLSLEHSKRESTPNREVCPDALFEIRNSHHARPVRGREANRRETIGKNGKWRYRARLRRSMSQRLPNASSSQLAGSGTTRREKLSTVPVAVFHAAIPA